MHLSKNFSHVCIIPSVVTDSAIRPVPANVEILNISYLLTKQYQGIKKNIRALFSVFASQLLLSKRKITYLKKLRYYLSYLSHKINISEELYSVLCQKKLENAVYYSYWFDYWMLPLTILRRQNKIKNLVTRAHGGDVYEYQHIEKDFFFPFRSFQVKNTDRVFCISEDGIEHLKERYPLSAKKLSLSRLGTKNNGINPANTGGIFTLVSCSTFFHYKNVGRIVDILSGIHFPLRWIHIGDEGTEKEEVLKRAASLQANIQSEFKGQLTQEEIFELYRTIPIDLFINVSKSEGLPVSLMEAISLGIPVMAPDVGGIREIVNSKTGFLFQPTDSNQKLIDFITALQNKTTSFNRNEIRNFWSTNFRAEKNYHELYQKFKTIAA